jgi:hypothetical protein
LYLLADKLNDLITANLTMDGIIRLSGEKKLNLGSKIIKLAFMRILDLLRRHARGVTISSHKSPMPLASGKAVPPIPSSR